MLILTVQEKESGLAMVCNLILNFILIAGCSCYVHLLMHITFRGQAVIGCMEASFWNWDTRGD